MDELMSQSVDKTANSTILVVASDPKFLKFLDMSLKLEFAYGILSLTRGKRAVELSRLVKSDLFIIDYHLLDVSALELSSQLHNITELESVPTIFLNSPVTSWSEPQPYNTTFLTMQFALDDLYSAVNEHLLSNR
jgi:response regulator RpfG family c-di-GMP phosphodiesterase